MDKKEIMQTETDNESAVSKTKKKKEVKLFPRNKLPKIFKKQYLPEKYEKKLMKCIYVSSDEEFVRKLFKPGKNKKGQDVMEIPQDKQVTKAELKKCKSLATELKNQKMGIKFVPLIAVACLCTALGIGIAVFKNVFVRWATVSSLEGIFSAQCDIDDVDFSIFGSKLSYKGIKQTNKNNPKTNLFELGNVTIDFNLTELLKGKFVVEDVSVSDVAIDTEREKEGKVFESKESKSFTETIQGWTTSAAEGLKAQFADYAPEKIFNDFQDQLQSPKTAEKLSSEITQKVDKWSSKPDEMKKKVTDYSASVDSIIKKLQSGTSKNAVLALQEAQELDKKGKEIQKDFESTVNDAKTDAKAVENYKKEIEAAVKADQTLVKNKVNSIKTTFSKEGIKKSMEEAVQSMIYKYCGEYTPYVNQIVDFAMDSLKNSSKSSEPKEAKEEKKESAKRAAGRDITFARERYPQFLMEKMKASGKEYQKTTDLFNLEVTDLSSNMDQWGKPAHATIELFNKTHSGDLIIDARKSAENLVYAEYNGKNFPIDFDAQVFKINSKGDITKAILTADENGSWKVGGTLKLSVSSMVGMDFTPEKVCSIYKDALKNIKKLDVGFTFGFDYKTGMFVTIDDKILNQLSEPIFNALTKALSDIKSEAEVKLSQYISEKTGVQNEEIKKLITFTGDVSTYNDQLKNKLNELTKQMANQGKQEASKAVSDGVGKLLGNSEAGNKAAEKTTSVLNNLFGGKR